MKERYEEKKNKIGGKNFSFFKIYLKNEKKKKDEKKSRTKKGRKKKKNIYEIVRKKLRKKLRKDFTFTRSYIYNNLTEIIGQSQLPEFFDEINKK